VDNHTELDTIDIKIATNRASNTCSKHPASTTTGTMSSPSPQLQQRLDLQCGFQTVCDMAVELLSYRPVHSNKALVRETLSLVEKAIRWKVYMEDERVPLDDGNSFLQLYQESLSNLMEEVQAEL
jgi:hypothetical protein